MRAESYKVELPRGTLVVPLSFDTFMAIALVPEDPAKKDAAGVDPGKVIRGDQDLPLVTRWAVLHAAAGVNSPGIKAIAAMGNDKDMMHAVLGLVVALLKMLAPPQETEVPKA